MFKVSKYVNFLILIVVPSLLAQTPAPTTQAVPTPQILIDFEPVNTAVFLPVLEDQYKTKMNLKGDLSDVDRAKIKQKSDQIEQILKNFQVQTTYAGTSNVTDQYNCVRYSVEHTLVDAGKIYVAIVSSVEPRKFMANTILGLKAVKPMAQDAKAGSAAAGDADAIYQFSKGKDEKGAFWQVSKMKSLTNEEINNQAIVLFCPYAQLFEMPVLDKPIYVADSLDVNLQLPVIRLNPPAQFLTFDEQKEQEVMRKIDEDTLEKKFGLLGVFTQKSALDYKSEPDKKRVLTKSKTQGS